MRRDREKKDEERQGERDEKRQQQGGCYQQTSDSNSLKKWHAGLMAEGTKTDNPDLLTAFFRCLKHYLSLTLQFLCPLPLSFSMTVTIRRGSLLEIQFNNSDHICSIFSETYTNHLQPHFLKLIF